MPYIDELVAEFVLPPSVWPCNFQGSLGLLFVILLDVLRRNERLSEAAINLAQLPEDQQKENRDNEQQELNVHFWLF
jgi:hypothetical protein